MILRWASVILFNRYVIEIMGRMVSGMKAPG